MSTATTARTWIRATPQHPCPICGKKGYCTFTSDGLKAGCMDVREGSYRTKQTDIGEMYLHRLTEEPREMRVPRPKTTPPTRDIMADRAVFGIMVRVCAALPEVARDELARRFGLVFGPQAAARFGIGYVGAPTLLAAFADADRTQAARNAGVLWRNGTVARSIEGRLIIPHVRDGLVHDIRIAGIKGIHEETKEISLPGSYADREIADLFYNHDALKDVGEDGTIHVCGGAYKVMALILAGLKNAVGLRGEAELSPGHIAALHAAGVRTIILHIDNEDPKPGEDRSAGRRLGLVKAERLAAAGFAVLIAEPPREPGTPKVDPDALLRDLGPRAVRDYAHSAIALDAWRVVIGVAPTSISDEAAAEIETLRQRCAKQQRTLSDVLHIRRNGAIKAERDTLTASVLHMAAAQEAGRVTPAGRIRQPLWVIADSVGKKKPAVTGHLKIGPTEGLFARELLEEVVVREVDEETGQTRNILRLKDTKGRVVEECLAEPVLGAALAYRHPTGEEATGSYYVTPLHEPTKILDILVTLDPVKRTKDGEVKDKWGGKREPCPVCKSERRLNVVSCADCGHEFSRKVEEPPADTPLPQRDEPDADASSIPPTPIEDLAAAPPTYPHVPLANIREEGSEEDDIWDPNFCNHPTCTARLNPALGKRYCWAHADVGLAPVAPSLRLSVSAAQGLDSDIIAGEARKWSLSVIDERLERYRERWAGGEDTAQLRSLLTDWRAIRAARVASESARTAPVGAE